jgi:Domain of unknown function (DUF4465)
MKKNLVLTLLISISLMACKKQNGDVVLVKNIGFEGLSLGSSGYWNGADGSGKFTSNGVTFTNSFSSSYGSWDSFAYSQKADVTNGSYTNQYSVFDAANGTNKFSIYYPPFDGDAFASFAKDSVYKVTSINVCNSTYTALTIKNGDPSFAKKFGGASGNDKDYYKMTVIGFGAKGDSLKSVEFYLADYRFDDNTKDYIVNKWTNLDLSSLGKVNKITFRFSSTDNGSWGMNTPAYVCLDNLKYEVVIPGIR